ncbi:phosphoribosylaminoimidazolesuccinocarboxamide synthase [Dehalobacterium formicoaceticum]|uniref:Phosphoribosylaminoimidazole-succinocarboxamide synthase n=1 Tax=Dehalobacterium formicoaceticum TaxID=51515 RepID=A0ABT1Y1S9_9FIRM|nr:phosphoribosylaminoimidazolesuccinocarboxamide synthase [Dehalobacterium formicoaceticum]MCR6544800.1 phosphoribosylaminoimidazolesuccinocarboxamide synthase [Dehalobacterium formicoaceticum]
MNLVYQGKTKDVYALEDGNYLLKFKDDVTGVNGVFDPGANTVGLSMEGAGKAGLRLTKFFFEKLNQMGIPTHFIDADLDQVTMTVKKAAPFGKGLEVICRFRAVGSFLRRYEMYAEDGQALDALVEVTLKDDDRNDPPISKDALDMLGILSKEEYEILKDLTKQIGNIVKDELAKKGLELYDIKFEFGRVGEDHHIALIDEISGGNMRAYRNNTRVEPLELTKIMVQED